MRPDKGSRSVRTDVQTDSETTYEAYVRLLNSLHRKVSRLGVCLSLSVLRAWGGEDFMYIFLLKSLNRKVSRSGAGALLTVCISEWRGLFALIFLIVYVCNMFVQFCMKTKRVEIFRRSGAIIIGACNWYINIFAFQYFCRIFIFRSSADVHM